MQVRQNGLDFYWVNPVTGRIQKTHTEDVQQSDPKTMALWAKASMTKYFRETFPEETIEWVEGE